VDLDDESNSGGWAFNSAWYYTGIGIYTPYDNIATSGEFIGIANTTPNPYDPDGHGGYLSTYDETGVVPAYAVNGTVTIGLPLSEESYRDLMFNVFVVPYGEVYLYIADPSWSFYQFNITGKQVMEEQAVVGRAMKLQNAILSTQSFAKSNEPFNVTVRVYNESNAPQKNVSVDVYNNLKSWKSVFKSVHGTTNATGSAVLRPWAPNVSVPTYVNVFAKPAGDANEYSLLESTQELLIPREDYLTIHFSKTLVNTTSTVNVQGTLYGRHGVMKNRTVSLSLNGQIIGNAKTDEYGRVNFTVNLSNYKSFISGNIVRLILISSMSGYYPARAMAELLIPGNVALEIYGVNYPSTLYAEHRGNISVLIEGTDSISSVILYMKYSDDSNYIGYPMQRSPTNPNEFYLNRIFTKPGNVSFYIIVQGASGTTVKSDVYTFTVEQSVPELNEFAVIILILSGLAVMRVKRE
jgi:hypothetical protein